MAHLSQGVGPRPPAVSRVSSRWYLARTSRQHSGDIDAGKTLTRVAVAALAVAAPAAAAPQVVDPANDANGGAYWAGDPDTPTPLGSQPYADVTSIEFTTTKVVKNVRGRRVPTVTGFTVALRLAAPPAPPGDGVAVYRVLASGPGCLFGIDYYTRAPAGHPQAAIQEWCVPSGVRRIALAPPRVSGATITWRVPLAAVPRNAKVVAGATLTDLHFETLVRSHEALCAGSAGTPGSETDQCALRLDGTFDRRGTYAVR